MSAFVIILAGLLGLIIGSFLNVVIYRLPRMMYGEKKINLAFPASHCPQCKIPLKWRHNIPVLSFALQRGKCSACKINISSRYPLVELLTAFFSIAVVMHFRQLKQFLPALLYIWLLIPMIFIDFEHQLLPDVLTLPLLVCGLGVNYFNIFVSFQSALLGAVIGYASFWLIAFYFKKLRHKDGIGGGDIKLIAALGAWTGWQTLPYLVLASSSAALIIIGIMVLMKRHAISQRFAYGPFLAIAGIAVLFTL
jgi:prepilin signal peptidase PulO-like enzyme (type II secretory pathway)